MGSRSHDKAYFYKYATCDTALKIIASRSFRWSSPALFNDPFDHQAGFVWPENEEELATELAASLERMVFDNVATVADGPEGLHQIVRDVRSLQKKMPRNQFRTLMRSTASAMKDAFKGMQPEFNREILSHLAHSRVFCVTERNDNLVMWSHYGDEHKGVAFRLKCDDEIDNALLVAERVTYSNEFIPFPSSAAYARYLTGEGSLKFSPPVRKIAYTKHTDWAYEKEWRVHVPMLDREPGDGYTFHEENPAIFEAIYIGCRMPPNDVHRIVTAIREHLPDTKVSRAKMNSNSFGLSFD